jgi:hypothetical protein
MKKAYFYCSILILIIFVSSCSKIENLESDIQNASSSKLDTIKNIGQLNTKSAIWDDNGTFRKVFQIEDTDPEEENELGELFNRATCSNLFSGVDRAIAKKSFAAATTTTYSAFAPFRNTLQTDTYMRSLNIPTSSTSNRVSQENRNIYISSSYLYAIKRESDGDFHIIIGDASSNALTNCEASGLPSTSSASYTKIKAVQDALIARFATDFCGKSSYTVFSPPILITKLNGSIFFDVDHAAGTVGPTGYRPTTAWEVHPISFIQF